MISFFLRWRRAYRLFRLALRIDAGGALVLTRADGSCDSYQVDSLAQGLSAFRRSKSMPAVTSAYFLQSFNRE